MKTPSIKQLNETLFGSLTAKQVELMQGEN